MNSEGMHWRYRWLCLLLCVARLQPLLCSLRLTKTAWIKINSSFIYTTLSYPHILITHIFESMYSCKMTISAVDANSEKADDKLLRRFSYFARNWFSSIFAMCIIVEPSFWLIAQPTTHQIQQSDTDSTSDPTITNNNQGHHLDIRNEQWLKETTITTSITLNIITKNDIWLTAMGIIAYCCWYLERERAVIRLQYQMC